MAILQREIVVETLGKGFTDITREVQTFVSMSGITNGLCSLTILHTSASLLIQENSDPAVLRDLSRLFDEIAPESRAWEHDAEGLDDMPAHVKAALTRTTETVPLHAGDLVLGTWQAIYVWEHRAAPHRRRVLMTLLG